MLFIALVLVNSNKVFGHSIPLLRRIPVLRFLLPFIAGILIAEVLPIFLHLLFLRLWMILIVGWILLLVSYRSGFRKRHYFGGLLQLYFMVAGIGLSCLFMEKYRPGHYTSVDVISGVKSRVISSLQEKKKSFKVLVEIEAIKTGEKWACSSGKMMVYLKKDTAFEAIRYGDQLMFNRTPEMVNGDSNNLAAKLSLHRQVFSRVYLNKLIHLKSNDNSFSFMATAIECRRTIASCLMEQFKGSKEAAIAVALLVGEEVSIDEDLSTAYAATGTLHVLAVSGMHVGLIYLLLGFIFKPLSNHKTGRHLYYPLVMSCVWCYAFIAGAAPSIVRASAMCMFFLIAKWIDRKNLGIGSLGASLFFLLMVNPFNIYEPGLQLSLFAVWGIIWLQQPILRLWVPGNWLFFKLWEVTCVSVAAQIMTLPVSLFYFGQFPNYFLIANLFVIPLTTACIYGCILQLLVTPLPLVQEYVIWINAFFLKISNFLVLEMKDWPGAVSRWTVSFSDMLFLYLLIFLIDYWVKTRNFRIVILQLLLFAIKSAITIIQLI